ncbi:MAG: peptide chain release factor 1 [Candidatus Dasytiphilus stammeri]
MNNFLISQLELLQKRYQELEILLITAGKSANYENIQTLSREYNQLTELNQIFNQWKKIQHNIKNSLLLLDDKELRELACEELSKLKYQNTILEKKIKLLMIPKDSNDEHNCYIELRAATGGNEAAIFAGDLFKMYSRYIELQSWKLKTLNFSAGDNGGYKYIIAKIEGKGAYGRLKFESGGHRVQRIPETESQGRIHTSSCTVAVMPEIRQLELNPLQLKDLKIDTFRSSGAGGQHVNTTDSAIRITHLPTGIVVECQDERSQHKNKSKALSVLNARIHTLEMAKRHEKETHQRRTLVGSGERSDRNRTYNFSKGRVTDHRINLSLYCLEDIMSGKLDLLLDPIIQNYNFNQIANFQKHIL